MVANAVQHSKAMVGSVWASTPIAMLAVAATAKATDSDLVAHRRIHSPAHPAPPNPASTDRTLPVVACGAAEPHSIAMGRHASDADTTASTTRVILAIPRT